jgi:hypothetical protein
MNAPDLLHRLMNVRSTAQTEAIMAGLPIVLPEHYQWLSAEERSAPWQPGKLHWVPAATAVMVDASSWQVSRAGHPRSQSPGTLLSSPVARRTSASF